MAITGVYPDKGLYFWHTTDMPLEKKDRDELATRHTSTRSYSVIDFISQDNSYSLHSPNFYIHCNDEQQMGIRLGMRVGAWE